MMQGYPWWVAGPSVFVALWGGHLLWWRLFTPRRDILALVVWLGGGSWVTFWVASPGERVAGFVLCLSLALQYLAIYPAFQASSPTLHLLASLSRSPHPLTLEQWRRHHPRPPSTEAFLNNAHWRKRGTLTPLGRTLVRALGYYRRLLRLPVGEG